MKHSLLLICLLAGAGLDAKKTRLTVYNQGTEAVLVSIGIKPWRPLPKSAINEHAAKNFFLPYLTVNTPYYFIVESSSDLTPKHFMIRLDRKTQSIVLERDHLILSSLPAVLLGEQDSFIKIVYRGSLRPEVPEVEFFR